MKILEFLEVTVGNYREVLLGIQKLQLHLPLSVMTSVLFHSGKTLHNCFYCVN